MSEKSFPRCELSIIYKLEAILKCHNELQAKKPNYTFSKYIQFYATHKRNKIHPQPLKPFDRNLFPTKIVVFDFDGTLTQRSHDESTWEKIWRSLGYSINECASLHGSYCDKKISHEKWCNITKDKFRDKGLSEKQLRSIAKSIKLLPDTKETLEKLHKRRIKLYMLSGSIKLIIREAMGNLAWPLFEDIKANDLIFDDLGNLEAIDGTIYDFEGKATYLKKLMFENNVSPLEVLFIGNSNNDEWASKSGRWVAPPVAKGPSTTSLQKEATLYRFKRA